MPRNDSVTAILDVEPHIAHRSSNPVSEEPFNILVVGAFSGVQPKSGRAPVEIDRDNFDSVVARFAPELKLEIAGRPLHLKFGDLDDFHPDALHRRIGLFGEIEETMTARPQARAASSNPPPAGSGESEVDAGILDRILADLPEPANGRPANVSLADATDLRGFIDRVLASYVSPKESSEQADRRQRRQAIKSELMRAILHARPYQALEAAWRGVWFLVRRIETGPNLKIFIADAGAGDSSLPDPPADKQWSVIILDRGFRDSEESLQALSQAGRQAMRWNAALLAESEPPARLSPTDAEDSRTRWSLFRKTPEAAHIGLALPRLIARMPYGQSGETTDEFRFEEMASAPQHSDYLWMNPAFGLGYLLAAAFEREGWRMTPGAVRDIEGMPLHVYREEGESVAKPCAELLLHEKDVEELLDAGIMPLASIRDTDRVRLVRFQSIAEPARALAGPWD
ncbi:MAG TPA: type VI secretion system contractile sheath large subunit [Bryobacteraceae bacterium]|jgi:type VI secretion system protein ImpC|nr:type VI secretion system contractile sheath large subunit [Bryobacteraceae bacterium]